MLRPRRLLVASFLTVSVLACSPAQPTGPAPASNATATRPAYGPTPRQATPLLCDVNTTPPPESGFPKGFDYPQQVQSWVHSGGGSRMRLHAWCLFAGLNQQSQPGGPLLWQSWKTSTQAFPFQHNPWPPNPEQTSQLRPAPLNARNLRNARVGGPNPVNNPAPIYPVNPAIVNNPSYKTCLEPIADQQNMYQLKDGTHFQSNGDIMIAGVIYNDAAFNWILFAGLNNAAVLNRQLPPQASSPALSIAPLPSSSIVLKPMFWPVKRGTFTALPVWDWDAHKPGSPDDGQYAGYEIQRMWTRAVAITDFQDPQPPASVAFLHGVRDSTGKPLPSNTYSNPPVASVNEFYYRQLNQSDLDQLSPCDRAILDASAYWAYNSAFEAGDYVVLIAMHIMTKEQPAWTFQSLWWHPDADNADCGRFCQDRPTNLSTQTFQNYLLTTTYGTTQNASNQNYYAPPGTQGPVWPIAYNPYIELAAAHPITTNCMNCHSRAAWPPIAHAEEGRAATYLQPTPQNPNVLEVFQASNPVFNGLLMLDAMWAVSDRAGFPTPAQVTAPAGTK